MIDENKPKPKLKERVKAFKNWRSTMHPPLRVCYKSFGVNPVCLATLASILGPISSLS